MTTRGKIRVGKIEEFSSGGDRHGELIIAVSHRVIKIDSDHRFLAFIIDVHQLDAVLHEALGAIII